ncbi:CDP-glycerol glycerophosphotransferase family protein [Methanobrevibacter sp.]|uniref:CDP-glycerol glycerophosphotransferase family protein n=1 Tax=Methanobrevibacter sp. TaxID=66852 RepID=UPI003865EB0B
MSKYKDLQKNFSRYLGDKTKKDLENELFLDYPELFNEVAKYRRYGVPKVYKQACKEYKTDEKTFFFESNLARQYTGNPRYIYERMLELYPDYTYIWSYDGDKSIIPGNPIVVDRGSDEYYRYLAKASVVINNTLFPIWYLRDETFYLQTWHGTPYKKMHWDVDLEYFKKGKTAPHFYVKSTGWSVLLSPNHYSTERFKSCFRYTGKILESGYPANDIFYDKERYESKRNEIRNKLNIAPDTLVYLYAPTWRNNRDNALSHSKFIFDLLLDPVKFLDNAPDDSVLLIRTHHMSVINESLDDMGENVIDVSDWDDAIELMCAADILVTDYSSIVFDWYCSKKPVIYFVPDLEKYETFIKGVYFDIRKVNCGILCKSEEELYENLDVRDAPFYEDFYDQFCSIHDGKSADNVINYIMNRNKVSSKKRIKNFVKKRYKSFLK